MIVCRVCGQLKEQAKGVTSLLCAACSAAYQKAYRERNRESLRVYELKRYAKDRQDPNWVAAERKRGREYWKTLRHEAIMAYGGYRCACCGETEPLFLSLDHVNNDGAEHRRNLGYDEGNGKGASSGILSWLKNNGYPAGFQILCMNCNHAKGRNGGVCPHQSKPREFGERPERIIPSQDANSVGV